MVKAFIESDSGKVFLVDGVDAVSGNDSGVVSVNTHAGAVVLTGEDINKSLSDKTSITSALDVISTNVDTMGGTVETISNDLEELGEQVAAIQTDVNGLKSSHSYQIFSGVPTHDPVTVGTTLARTLVPQTAKTPANNTDFSLSSDGCGIVCAKSGVVHIKKIVTVGTATTSNIYQELYKNQATIANGQTFIHAAGCLSMEADFYTDVVANDELCIMADTTQTEFIINYTCVTVFVEYL